MIDFKLSGDVSPQNMPIIELTTALSEFSYIIDKAYLVAIKQTKFSKKNRDNCYLVNRNIKKGSFESTLEIMMTTAGVSLPNISPFSPSDLWELAKNSFEFIKKYIEMKSKGENISVVIDNTNINAPLVIGNNNTVIIGANLAEIADRCEPYYKALSSVIDKKGISEISAFEGQSGFKIGAKEKNLFNPKTRLDKETISLKCNIVRFDKESKKGRLELKDSVLDKDSFKFKSLSESPIGVISAMQKNQVNITALVEYNIHSTGIETVAGFQIISIDDIENTLL